MVGTALRAFAHHTLAETLSRIGLQPGGLDTGDGADLVIVGGVAGDADRAEQARAVLDQDATRYRHETALGQRIDGVDEIGLLLRALKQRPRAHAHGERAPGLAVGDL